MRTLLGLGQPTNFESSFLADPDPLLELRRVHAPFRAVAGTTGPNEIAEQIAPAVGTTSLMINVTIWVVTTAVMTDFSISFSYQVFLPSF
ncbi:MAG TPA: hypothetical protein VGO47_09940 [Chlamydiales bacterium]|nr:hypothetical protein [Chlamydiales bacterium]